MSSNQRDPCRLVPQRFFINESTTNMCKVEKLTNLFPNMKSTIELEFFKINNLSRTIDRLSHIYAVISTVDKTEDMHHIFLGPYHLTIGPAVFGALQLRNLSTVLLAASHSKLKGDSTQQKRRRETVIRRFRRIVRKLIFIKSIINQIELPSILTPYNQYELYRNGIYDLVLANHSRNFDLAFNDESFINEIDYINETNDIDSQNDLLASKFTKINNLLNLISTDTPNQSAGNELQMQHPLSSLSEPAIPVGKSENRSRFGIDSSTICCAQHAANSSALMLPLVPPSFHDSNLFLSRKLSSRSNSAHSSRRSSFILPEDKRANSVLDLTQENTMLTSPAIVFNTELQDNKVCASHTNTSSSKEDIDDEEQQLIKNMSSLLIEYMKSKQTDSVSCTHENDQNTRTSSIAQTCNDCDQKHQSDNLLRRVRAVVNTKLCTKVNSDIPVVPQCDDSNVVTQTSSSPNIQLLESSATFDQNIITDEFSQQHLDLSMIQAGRLDSENSILVHYEKY